MAFTRRQRLPYERARAAGKNYLFGVQFFPRSQAPPIEFAAEAPWDFCLSHVAFYFHTSI